MPNHHFDYHDDNDDNVNKEDNCDDDDDKDDGDHYDDDDHCADCEVIITKRSDQEIQKPV